jgi:hypothetical protein
MVIGHQAEAADVAFEGDDKFWGEPEAEAEPQKGFKILLGDIQDIRAVLDGFMAGLQRKPADIDGTLAMVMALRLILRY